MVWKEGNTRGEKQTLVNILKLKPEVLSRLLGNSERCKYPVKVMSLVTDSK